VKIRTRYLPSTYLQFKRARGHSLTHSHTHTTLLHTHTHTHTTHSHTHHTHSHTHSLTLTHTVSRRHCLKLLWVGTKCEDDIVTRLRVNGLEFESRQGQEILSFSQTSRPAVGGTKSFTQWVPFFPRNHAAGPDADHSASSSAELKNKWGYNSSPPICLHDVDRDNFTFIFTFTFTLPAEKAAYKVGMTTLLADQNGNDYEWNCGSELRCNALKKSWKSPLQLLAG